MTYFPDSLCYKLVVKLTFLVSFKYGLQISKKVSAHMSMSTYTIYSQRQYLKYWMVFTSFYIELRWRKSPLTTVLLVMVLLIFIFIIAVGCSGGSDIDNQQSHLIRKVSLMLIANPFIFPSNSRTLHLYAHAHAHDGNAHLLFAHDIRSFQYNTTSHSYTYAIRHTPHTYTFKTTQCSRLICCRFTEHVYMWLWMCTKK